MAREDVDVLVEDVLALEEKEPLPDRKVNTETLRLQEGLQPFEREPGRLNWDPKRNFYKELEHTYTPWFGALTAMTHGTTSDDDLRKIFADDEDET